jgi:transmembrane sensor
MESYKRIEDQAAEFLARRDGGEWTAADQTELEQWMTESTAHRVAYLRLEVVWEEAGRLKALSAGLPRGIVPQPGEWQHSPFFNPKAGLPQQYAATPPAPPMPAASRCKTSLDSRRVRFFAIAASLLLVTVGIGVYMAWSPTGDGYRTPIGGIEQVPLRDGSHITLNTATQVHVELTPHERHIRLDAGEAFFEVAHDATRPFVVQVGNKRVIAVGTQFSVRRNGEDMLVLVTEGRVRIEDQGAIPQVSSQGRTGEVFVAPGGVASAGDEGIVVQKRGLAEVEDDLSWRQGYLTFHDTSLADAVAEFNRYSTHKITIEDPNIAAIRISGTFRALNYQAFVRVLDDGFAIHARSNEDQTTLTK